ncbi:MAG: hypothetical protein ABIG44_19050 [Planctomycetota bacterium]
MDNERSELRGIAWTQVFPFLRLFKTFRLATHGWRLLLGLACVLSCYIGGRILDGIWLSAGSGVLIEEGGRLTEIDAYTMQGPEAFEAWKTQAEQTRRRLAANAIVELDGQRSAPEIEEQLTTRPVSALLQTSDHETNVSNLLEFVDTRLSAALDVIDADEDLTDNQKEEQREQLKRAADTVRLGMSGCEPSDFNLSGRLLRAIAPLLMIGTDPTDEERELIDNTIPAQVALNNLERTDPAGPFISMLKYEMGCFAGAIRGVCTFRWGIAEGAFSPQPSMLGSIASAGKGIAWLVTQRPCFAVFYAILHFIVFAFFGGAICRHAAVQTTRDESISVGEALRFARQRYTGLLLAPAVPAGIFILAAIVMWLGGLVGAIPYIGVVLAGLFYGLALLGGFALAMILIATVLGLHLMWPTIAVEGSDAFDAVTHALGYIGQRIWNTGFYTVALLLYGGVSFVMVRVIGTVLLKLTHVVTGAGMSFFGAMSSSQTSTISKLDAMWHMPDWEELALLPTTSGTPFWGTFANAPLSGSEWLATIFLACWIFMVVGLVGGFVVSFFFCGSTQMYLLLRRDVDAVDYDEIYYEEPEDEFPPLEPRPPTEAADSDTDEQPPAEPPADEDTQSS